LYAKDNPKEIQQKALPVWFYCIILSFPATELCHAIGELAVAAYFWAMQLCKYSEVSRAEQRQRKQLCFHNILFIKGGNILNHTSAELNLADYASITFKRQKNERKSDTVTQWRTSDPVMCPAKLWASIVKRILTYKGTNIDSPVSLALHRNSTISITLEMDANLLKDGIVAIGKRKARHQYTQSDLGPQMAMYLAGVPIFSIMLIGRWSSLAFLKYIRKQVQEFSCGIF
jgi:hypothetical protein